MPNWEEIKRMFRQASTPEERAESVRALQEHIPANQKNKLLSTLSKGGVNMARLGNLANEPPEVFERVKKAITGGE